MCASMCECDCVYVFMHAYINNLTHLISPLHSSYLWMFVYRS